MVGSYFSIYCRWFSDYVVSFYKNKILQIIPSKGGNPRLLHSFVDKRSGLVHTCWSSDSEYVYFPKEIREGVADSENVEYQGLWRVSVAGGEPQSIGLSMVQISQISLHPDGKQFVFCSDGPEVRKPELWVMENFLPGSQRKTK